MSRFEEVVNAVIGEVVLGESSFKAEQLAQRIAEGVRERQDARRAEVTIAARYPEHKPAPVSGIPTQEIYTLYGSAVASARGTRRLVGVAAQGMTACPCAQELVAGNARERLRADGFTDDEIARIFDAVPVATHNQRGLGTLHIGCPEDCDTELEAATLLGDRRELDVQRDLRADEALRRGRGRREGPPPPALRRGLRARDDRRRRRRARRARRRRVRLRAPGEPRDDPPAQRRRRALRAARRAAPRAARRASTSRITPRCASGWTPASRRNPPRRDVGFPSVAMDGLLLLPQPTSEVR